MTKPQPLKKGDRVFNKNQGYIGSVVWVISGEIGVKAGGLLDIRPRCMLRKLPKRKAGNDLTRNKKPITPESGRMRL